MQRQQTGGRAKAVLFFAGALLVAGLTSYLVWHVIQRANTQIEAARRGPEKVPVVVALHDLHVGVPLDTDDLKVIKVLPELVSADQVFSSVEDLVADPETGKPRTPREKILANEFVRDERLANEKAGVGLNAIISRGKRAMTIETDAESSLAGLLQPGNKVDVIVTIRPDDQSKGKWLTETILQNLKVLAVGDTLNPTSAEEDAAKKKKSSQSSRRKTPVTLEVTPEESQKLALARSRGDLHLVLRSDIDIDSSLSEGPINTNELIGMADPEETPEPPKNTGRKSGGRGSSSKKASAEAGPDYQKAEVIEGSSTTIELFNEAGEKVTDEKNKKKNR